MSCDGQHVRQQHRPADRVDQPAAFYYWSKALREAPLAELPGEEVERLAAAVHSWDEVVALCTDILAERRDNDTQRKILLKLARVHEVELHDAARAASAGESSRPGGVASRGSTDASAPGSAIMMMNGSTQD